MNFTDPRFVPPRIALAVGLLVLTLWVCGSPARAQTASQTRIIIDDFESYRPGELPVQWKYITSAKEVLPLYRKLDEREQLTVVEEGGNQFAKVYTHNEVLRATVRNGVNFDWNLQKHPVLQWRWRAHRLPEGANEKRDATNDTGAAVYVTFGSDWLGRPISIKYTYSSTLPVGSVVDYGPLKVLVLDSAREGTGTWKQVTRNVIADYRQLFGEAPPNRPVSITLWSDTDTTHGVAEVDFDDISLRPSFR